MTKTQAQARIAATLAFNSHEHAEAAKGNSNLRENTCSALTKNREAAEALGFLDLYLANCATLNVDGV